MLYAYLRMMGATQRDAGSAVGRKKRTVQEWEEDKVMYAHAREEARQRWLGELTDAARVALLATIRAGAGELALKVLERIDVELAPAKQQFDVTLEGKGLAVLLDEARQHAGIAASVGLPPMAQA